jgi:prepilin peptidase CpaA
MTMLLLLQAVLVLMVVIAMLWDVATLEIPDTVSVVLVAAFASGAAALGMGWMVLLSHATAGLILFAAGVALHRAGVWGGGDVKLAGALALWFGWAGLPSWLLAVSVTGGVLALILLGLRRVGVPAGFPTWLARLGRDGEAIPYGVALGGGALMTCGAAFGAWAPA